MILTGAGNVGIGTTAPSNRLSVSGSANITSNAYVGGDLGIGTTSPAERLHVVGGSNVQTTGGGFLILGPMTSTNVAIDNNEIMARNNGAASSLFLNKSGGNVAIGTSSAPQQKLDVNGAIRSRGIFFPGSFNPGFGQPGNFLSFGHPGVSEDYLGYDAHYFFFWDSPGGGDTELPIVQAGGFSDVSDVRLKKDIRNIEGGLEKVMRLQGISYRFDGRKIDPDATQYDDNERVRLGFSAQAVAEVVPEVVNYSEALDTYGISYGAMVPLLVEAMKEQQSLIEDLRSQQADLLERLEKLEALTGAAGTTRK